MGFRRLGGCQSIRRRLLVFGLLGGLVMLVCGCAFNGSREPAGPAVYIQPGRNVYRLASLGVLPFEMPDNASGSGSRVARIFGDRLLADRAFSKVIMLQGDALDPRQAMRVGRESGVSMVMTGRVHYLLPGTELGGARVDLSVRLLNCRTGNTVWYVRRQLGQDWDYPETGFWDRLSAAFIVPESRPAAAGPVVPGLLARAADDVVNLLNRE